ncbi:hypothetical protein M8J77_015740 [Diaphorina citri]|nr:hypothetical protein M8J77_013194 [Diaphorina citri]KAI5747534.1 hypothetical protein M8J77_015740 [Diaphorina citri]
MHIASCNRLSLSNTNSDNSKTNNSDQSNNSSKTNSKINKISSNTDINKVSIAKTRAVITNTVTPNNKPITSNNISNKTTVEVIESADITKQNKTTYDDNNLLPYNQSILSMGTPACNDLTQDNSTFNGITPHRPVITIEELRNQIHCLAQEIINKQILIDELTEKSRKDDQELANKQNQIDRLMEKSKGDEKDMKDMIETIRLLEKTSECANQSQCSNKPSKHTRRRMNRKKRKTVESQTQNQTVNDINNVNTAAPETRRNCVVIGDSQTRNLRNILDKHSDEYNFKSYVSPGGNFTKVLNDGFKCWKAELENKDENKTHNHLVIMAGTIDGFYDLEWKNIKQGFRKIKEISQNTYVTIILVPYHLKNKRISFNMYQLNKAIFRYFKHVTNVEVIDTNAIVNRPMYYRYDGYHLNDVGKNVLAHSILKSLHRLDTSLKRDPVRNFY